VKHGVDQELRDQARRFRLACFCEACAYFDEVGGGCGNAYPNRMHRQSVLEECEEIEFCKEFELC
jgi:hypothetical protein